MNKPMCLLIALAFLLAGLPAAGEELGPRASKTDLELGLANPAAGDPGGGSSTADSGMQKRSPLLAGALSLILPGAGQIYNEQYVVGGLWMAAEIAMYLGAFAYAGAFDSSEQMSFAWHWEATLMVAMAAGFHLFSVFDAVTEAARVNENLDKFTVAYNPAHDSFSVGYAFAW
jgi:hypothetical protein